MGLKTKLDTLDGLDDALKGLYIEKDGTFYLDADLEDVSGLKSALEKERAERRRLKAEADKFAGVDPDRYAKLIKDAEDADAKKAADEGNWDALRDQLTTKHSEEMEAKDLKVSQLVTTVEHQLIDVEAVRALAEAGGVSELLLPHVKSRARAVEEDGVYVVRVIDEKGKTRISDAAGTPMTIKNLVAEMKTNETYMPAFAASGESGSGSTKGGPAGQGGEITPEQVEKMSMAEYRKARDDGKI
ncbi:MAG: hypothetical protein DRJ65_00060 [Acidobacteria bacterium]|nr:MAG: hypothetical protein DRJ65_00060 [Acidobacteriota bacterium]